MTTAVLEAKITEAEANPDLDAEAKAKLIALYREALSNRMRSPPRSRPSSPATRVYP